MSHKRSRQEYHLICRTTELSHGGFETLVGACSRGRQTWRVNAHDSVRIPAPRRPDQAYSVKRASSVEGIVSTRLDSIYCGVRSPLWGKVKTPNAQARGGGSLGEKADRVMGTNRVRAFLMVFVGALLLGGCAAKQKTESSQPASDTATTGGGPPVSPNNLDLARDEYDRAVTDYQNCLLENTSNLSVCERQRAAMNDAATILFGPPNKKNTIVNEGK
jgi:hypothetical protein